MTYRLTNLRGLLSKEILLSGTAVLIYLAVVKLLIPFLTSSDFGFHRDEFLYLAMGDHLDWGYLEVPPSIAVFAKIAHWLFGGSLIGTRLIPALVGALTLILTGLMARELGGGRFAQILAGVAYLFSVVYLRINLLFQPVSFDLFYFVLGTYLLIRILKKPEPRLWIILGVVIGLGLLNKYSMLLFGFGATVGLLLTSQRRLFTSVWPWVSAAIAVVLILPNLLWQSAHGWPLVEHMRVLSESQLANVEPVTFVLVQLLMNLFAAPVWLTGLFFYLFSKKGRDYRAIGWMYISLLIILLLLSGKVYYLAPAYPMLFAAGALAIEKYNGRTAGKWIRHNLLSFIIVGGVVLSPGGIPFMSKESVIGYFRFTSRYMGMGEILRWETGEMHELPQDYADMLGWEELVAVVAETYADLPVDEQARCAIFASNYGLAGAIDHYKEQYNLPHPISQHGSYWLWGYGDNSGEILVTVGFEKEHMDDFYRTIQPGRSFYYPHARESGVPVFILHDQAVSLADIWAYLKAYRY